MAANTGQMQRSVRFEVQAVDGVREPLQDLFTNPGDKKCETKTEKWNRGYFPPLAIEYFNFKTIIQDSKTSS